MARALDERQQRELTAFVNALYDAAGYTSTSEWARESGYDRSKLTNLRNGRAAVDGYNLLRLIRAAAARANVEPATAAVLLAHPRAEGDADRLDKLADMVGEAIELLRGEHPEPGAAGRTRAKRPR